MVHFNRPSRSPHHLHQRLRDSHLAHVLQQLLPRVSHRSHLDTTWFNMFDNGDFQDPKMEVLYHIRPYFVGIFPYIGLIYGRYLQFRILKWPLMFDMVWLTWWGTQSSLDLSMTTSACDARCELWVVTCDFAPSGGTGWIEGPVWYTIYHHLPSGKLT